MLYQLERNLEFTTDSKLAAQPKKKGKKPSAAKSNNDEPTLTVEQITDEFVKQTHFFKSAIVREQIFNLQAIKLVA